jgi:pSer/pThr/pTyr-binding forkhead associated (FHA) protein
MVDNRIKQFLSPKRVARTMRLVLKQGDSTIREFQFSRGPIYIGRHTKSQVFLPDKTVSRQHAVLFSTQAGKWMAEDLDSANKTYLNDEIIHKAEIKSGDILRIADYTLEVDLEKEAGAETAVSLEETLVAPSREQQITVRRLDSKQAASPLKLPAKRIKDFAEATGEICRAKGLDEVLRALLHIAAKQFSACRSWCALRNQTSGPMTAHAGKKQSGPAVQLEELKLNQKITEAVEQGQFLLFSRLGFELGEERIRSALIAPVMGQTGCFGVIYIDNDTAHEQYTLSDLDYLMLLALHTASILENF